MATVNIQDISQTKGVTVQTILVSLSVPVTTTSLVIDSGNSNTIQQKGVSNSLKATIQT